MPRKPATKQIHLVLYGGHPLWGREDRTTALEDAQRLIVLKYDEAGGSSVFGLLPPDASHTIAWWHNKVPASLRYEVMTIDVRDITIR